MPNYQKTTVEIEKLGVLKEYLAHRHQTMRDYLNQLINEDIMRNGGEHFSNLYFKRQD